MAYRDENYTEFEGKIKWTGDKSRLIEFTLPIEDGHHLYFVPKKCTIDYNETDGTGNFLFLISDWWVKRAHDFRADEGKPPF